jgi:hypothetical protein
MQGKSNCGWYPSRNAYLTQNEGPITEQKVLDLCTLTKQAGSLATMAGMFCVKVSMFFGANTSKLLLLME